MGTQATGQARLGDTGAHSCSVALLHAALQGQRHMVPEGGDEHGRARRAHLANDSNSVDSTKVTAGLTSMVSQMLIKRGALLAHTHNLPNCSKHNAGSLGAGQPSRAAYREHFRIPT